MTRIYTAGRTIVPHSCADCGEDILPGQAYRRYRSVYRHHAPPCRRAKSKPIPLKRLSKLYWKSLLAWYEDKPRLLRRYCVRVARDHYTCYDCERSRYIEQRAMSDIFPGEPYFVEIYAHRTKIEVRRYHESCPTFYWDDDELHSYLDELDDQKEEPDEELPLAA